jgi:hypothetical protein
MADEKRLAAGRAQRLHDRLEPEAIGIRFDHRAAFGSAANHLQGAPIGDQSGEIHGQYGAGLDQGNFSRRVHDICLIAAREAP